MIQLEKIERRFGPRVLFADLDWLISPGERLGFVGPNGAGKTTLLRILCGRDQPDAGRVHRGRSIRVAYLPQEVETLDRGSVLQVVVDGHEEAATLAREIEQLEGRLASLPSGTPELAAVTERYGELRSRYESIGGDGLPARARAILGGLGIPEDRFAAPLSTLSGGWRMRAVLARLLLSEPDLLLLDEPTNHLDLDAIDWLEGFLDAWPGAFVIVSHDRYFLNRMVREIVDLDSGRLRRYPGNYDAYLAALAQRESEIDKAAARRRREVAQVQRFIDRFRFKASKARQVQSRVKALSKLDSIDDARRQQAIRFGFPPAPRAGDVIARAESVTKGFGDRPVYQGLDFLMRRGDRIALVGPNGAGKSTLLKLLAGEVPIDSGLLELGHNVHFEYYAQHQLDGLSPTATVLEELESVAEIGERQRLRKLLGGFLFHGDDVDKKVEVLSGGEKARLTLAKILVRPSNLLLLDEPTNHLDLRSREVLEDALNEYTGSLIVVSHDRYFIDRVATSVGVVGHGGLEIHPGGYDEYRQRVQTTSGADPTPSSDAGGDRREDRRREAEERNRRYRERKRAEELLAPVEREIAELEQRSRELERTQSLPETYRNPSEASRVGRERGEVDGRLASLYERWEQLAASTEPE